jgi:Tfp pilus assembly protein PilE
MGKGVPVLGWAARRRDTSGMTLTEIMLLLLLIGLLSAIAIPSFVQSRNASRRAVCLSNLHRIDNAKEQATLDMTWNTGDPVDDSVVNSYIKGNAPRCPAGGSYTYQPVGTDPVCTVSGHTM